LTTKPSTSAGRADHRHPFGVLLAQYRARRPGLSQTRLAQLAGYDQAILVRMAQGKKDLTGPSGRERIVRLIDTLAEQGALDTLEEANALLLAATQPPLFEHHPVEAKLLARLAHLPAGHRVRRTNLPAALSSFVGRTHEIADVKRLLKTTRLLTLTGAGGAGKTRLAQQAAAEVLIGYADGVWYAELAALQDAASIADAVARALGLVQADRPALEHVCDFLRERHVLMVLDNCEHLIEDAATFAITLLQACPRAMILATSREALNVEGETALRVPPMQQEEAVQLFMLRGQAARGGTDLNAPSDLVKHICERLDGMPLAIELAAARLNTLSLSDIAAGLDDRFTLLAHGRRGALSRHQTLRAMIDWSYELLSAQEKVVFRRLGVFIDGWALEEAAQVVDVEGFAEVHLQLIHKSLIVTDDAGDHMRYHFLETLREYAQERLKAAGEWDALHRRHAEVFARLAVEAEPHMRGGQQRQWVAKIKREYSNFRRALGWSFAPGHEVVAGYRIVTTLAFFWAFTSDYERDGFQWIAQAYALAREDHTTPRLAVGRVLSLALNYRAPATVAEERQIFERIRPWFEAGGDSFDLALLLTIYAEALTSRKPNDAEGQQLLDTAISIAERVNAPWVLGLCHAHKAWHLANLGESAKAEQLIRTALSLNLACGNETDLSSVHFDLADPLLQQLRFREALDHAQESVSLAREWGHPMNELRAMVWMAECHRHLGDLPLALSLAEGACKIVRDVFTPRYGRLAVLTLAKVLNDMGEAGEAERLVLDEMKVDQRGMNIQHRRAESCFDVLACIASRRGDAARCARLAGCADAELALIKKTRYPYSDWEYAPHFERARAELGEEAFERLRAEGRAMTSDQAMAYALGER
jgi:predicted ATPase